jgi:zinc and cadmium transporter
MAPVGLLIVYCVLILLASLAGGWIPLMVRLTHRRMQLAVSLVAGVMLGVGLLHLLPHALIEAPDALDAIFAWTLLGFLTMFFIERFFCYHHHEVPQVEPTAEADEGSCHENDHALCPHVRSDSHALTWSGAAVGLSLHTVIAGIALAASVQAESGGGHVASLAGMGTFLVIFLHKPFDAMTISTLMTAGGWSVAARHLVNGLFALMIPAGVVLFHLGLGHAHSGSHAVAYALAFSAGTFLCIATSDLLPELQFHAHDRVALSAAMLLGLGVAWVIGIVETAGHGHHAHPPGAEGHDHSGHDHHH